MIARLPAECPVQLDRADDLHMTTRNASKVIKGGSYLLGHIAAGTACFVVIVLVPLAVMLVLAVISNDAGGPLFWPIFLLILVICGLASAGVLSLLTAGFDLLRMRWRLPYLLPPVLVASSVSVTVGWVSHLNAPMWFYPASAIAAGTVFALYSAAVSSFWILPRLVSQILSERVRFPYGARKNLA